MNPLPDSPKAERGNELRSVNPPLAAHLPRAAGDIPPDLALVVGRWAGLPGPLRAGIVAMVRAAGDTAAATEGGPEDDR